MRFDGMGFDGMGFDEIGFDDVSGLVWVCKTQLSRVLVRPLTTRQSFLARYHGFDKRVEIGGGFVCGGLALLDRFSIQEIGQS